MDDDELKALIEQAGEDMPDSTRTAIAGSISSEYRRASTPPSSRGQEQPPVVVPLEPGAGRTSARARRRWIAVGGTIALAAALIGVFVVRDGSDHAEVTDTVTPSTPATTASTAPSTTPSSTPSTGAPTTVASTAETPTTETPTTETPTTETPTTEVPTTSIAPAAPVGLPDGLAVWSLSFPSRADGWVVAFDPAMGSTSGRFLRTTDGGASWSVATEPPLGDGLFDVEFADLDNGWILGMLNGSSILYSTHDGGTTWNQVGPSLDGAGEEPMSIAAAGGVAHLVTFETPADPNLAGRGPAFRLFTAAAGSDDFTESPVIVEPGAGPVFDVQFAFATNPDGTPAGWFVYNDRGYIGGARLVGGLWTEWSAPCAGGAASLAASPDASSLVVGCSPTGFEGAPPPIALHVSHDGGDTFVDAAALPNGAPDPAAGPLPSLAFVAAPSAEAIVAGYTGADGAAVIVRSTDAGSTWMPATVTGDVVTGSLTTVPGQPQTLIVTSTDTAGAAIVSSDGGATWNSLPAVPVG